MYLNNLKINIQHFFIFIFVENKSLKKIEMDKNSDNLLNDSSEEIPESLTKLVMKNINKRGIISENIMSQAIEKFNKELELRSINDKSGKKNFFIIF